MHAVAPSKGGGGSTIPELTADPSSPTAGQAWVLKQATTAASPVLTGFFGAAFPMAGRQQSITRFDLSVNTSEGIKRAQLS